MEGKLAQTYFQNESLGTNKERIDEECVMRNLYLLRIISIDENF